MTKCVFVRSLIVLLAMLYVLGFLMLSVVTGRKLLEKKTTSWRCTEMTSTFKKPDINN